MTDKESVQLFAEAARAAEEATKAAETWTAKVCEAEAWVAEAAAALEIAEQASLAAAAAEQVAWEIKATAEEALAKLKEEVVDMRVVVVVRQGMVSEYIASGPITMALLDADDRSTGVMDVKIADGESIRCVPCVCDPDAIDPFLVESIFEQIFK